MYKLVALLFLATVVVAKPGAILSPVITDVVSEKVIESHGNSVVHASAPVVQTYASLPYTSAVYSSHGNAVVHGSPVLHSVPLAYSHGHGYGLTYNYPLVY